MHVIRLTATAGPDGMLRLMVPVGEAGEYELVVTASPKSKGAAPKKGTPRAPNPDGLGWTAGVGGYYYQQLSSDKQSGATLANSKGKAFAIGPSVKYDSGKGWFVTLKWQKETMSENRAQGNAFWMKAVFPL